MNVHLERQFVHDFFDFVEFILFSSEAQLESIRDTGKREQFWIDRFELLFHILGEVGVFMRGPFINYEWLHNRPLRSQLLEHHKFLKNIAVNSTSVIPRCMWATINYWSPWGQRVVGAVLHPDEFLPQNIPLSTSWRIHYKQLRDIFRVNWKLFIALTNAYLQENLKCHYTTINQFMVNLYHITCFEPRIFEWKHINDNESQTWIHIRQALYRILLECFPEDLNDQGKLSFDKNFWASIFDSSSNSVNAFRKNNKDGKTNTNKNLISDYSSFKRLYTLLFQMTSTDGESLQFLEVPKSIIEWFFDGWDWKMYKKLWKNAEEDDFSPSSEEAKKEVYHFINEHYHKKIEEIKEILGRIDVILSELRKSENICNQTHQKEESEQPDISIINKYGKELNVILFLLYECIYLWHQIYRADVLPYTDSSWCEGTSNCQCYYHRYERYISNPENPPLGFPCEPNIKFALFLLTGWLFLQIPNLFGPPHDIKKNPSLSFRPHCLYSIPVSGERLSILTLVTLKPLPEKGSGMKLIAEKLFKSCYARDARWYHNYKESQLIDMALRNAIAFIMGRNLSHHVGSHVLERVLRELRTRSPMKEQDWRYYQLFDYIKERLDFISELLTHWREIPW